MSQFLYLDFAIQCNKIRQQTDGVMGGTPLPELSINANNVSCAQIQTGI